jgi:hypothetical protein
LFTSAFSDSTEEAALVDCAHAADAAKANRLVNKSFSRILIKAP